MQLACFMLQAVISPNNYIVVCSAFPQISCYKGPETSFEQYLKGNIQQSYHKQLKGDFFKKPLFWHSLTWTKMKPCLKVIMLNKIPNQKILNIKMFLSSSSNLFPGLMNGASHNLRSSNDDWNYFLFEHIVLRVRAKCGDIRCDFLPRLWQIRRQSQWKVLIQENILSFKMTENFWKVAACVIQYKQIISKQPV